MPSSSGFSCAPWRFHRINKHNTNTVTQLTVDAYSHTVNAVKPGKWLLDHRNPNHNKTADGYAMSACDLYRSFHCCLVSDIESGSMLPINEIHSSPTFPMYADMDMKVRLRSVGEPLLFKMMEKVASQVSRFYGGRSFRMVVCSRPPTCASMNPLEWRVVPPEELGSKVRVPIRSMELRALLQHGLDVPAQQWEALRRSAPSHMDCVLLDDNTCVEPMPGEVWRHGYHLYWPDLIVDYDTAMAIRAGIISGLDSLPWSEDFGSMSMDWEDILDTAVYCKTNTGGGLRMVGAPKAVPCPNSGCVREEAMNCPCFDTDGKVIDTGNVYNATHEMVDGTLRPFYSTANTSITVRTLQATSIRCPEPTPATTGFAPYPGFSMPLRPPAAGSSGGGRKRKAKYSSDEAKLPQPYKATSSLIEDPAVHEICRKQLHRHSSHYDASKMTVRTNGKAKFPSIRVLLSGDGARWCGCKGDFHTSSNVYMVIEKSSASDVIVSRMGCWSPRTVVRPHAMCDCRSYIQKSKPHNLSESDACVLFPSRTVSRGGDSHFRAMQQEIKRLCPDGIG